jgi:hypothetical protein
MKKFMMIMVAVAAIGFTACTTKTEEQKTQTELTTDEQKVDENATEVTEQDSAKAETATTEENTEAQAEEKTEENKEK